VTAEHTTNYVCKIANYHFEIVCVANRQTEKNTHFIGRFRKIAKSDY